MFRKQYKKKLNSSGNKLEHTFNLRALKRLRKTASLGSSNLAFHKFLYDFYSSGLQFIAEQPIDFAVYA